MLVLLPTALHCLGALELSEDVHISHFIEQVASGLMAQDDWAQDAPRPCRPTCSNSMSTGLGHLPGRSQMLYSTSIRLRLPTMFSLEKQHQAQTGAVSDQAAIQLAPCLRMHVPSLTEMKGPGTRL